MKHLIWVLLLLASLSAIATSAQTTYQPTGNHVIYNDGSTDFYFTLENPRTGQQVGVTVFFYCSEQVASVIIAGTYNEVPIKGGSISALGMTFTINLSPWTIYDAYCGRMAVSRRYPVTTCH